MVARLIAKALRQNPALVLGLATGRTMEHVYALLANMHKQEGLDFADCRTFNLDEYVGLRPEDKQSYRFYMNHHLFAKINIDLGNTRLPDGMAADLDAACDHYEQAIRQAGGIDLQLLGIGHNGHIGFNEPGTPFGSTTHLVHLSDSTRKANARFFPSIEEVPTDAVSMGIKTVMNARAILLFGQGTAKADVIRAAVSGPVTEAVPASILQLHPNVTLYLDSEAAKYL